MPAYNAEEYIKESIESILNQTYRNFEFIIINDGSIDTTEEIVRSFNDPRITYLKNDGNIGLSRSFNFGISKAQGKYIARMDSDDIAMETRLEIQVKYLQDNTHIDIIGSSVTLIDGKNKRLGAISKPREHDVIKWQSLFSTPLIHPTVIGKNEVFKNNLYNESLINSEDYELWSRLIFSNKAIFHNLKRSLLSYRIYPKSFTRSLGPKKILNSIENGLRNIEHYLKLDNSDKNLLIELRQNNYLSVTKLFRVVIIYTRIFYLFVRKEKPTYIDTLTIFLSLIKIILFVFKTIFTKRQYDQSSPA